jgi:hypothetical protein
LAYVYFRDDSGRERRAIIDDLKYEGADRVLARLMKHFKGEVLDRVDEAGDAGQAERAPNEAHGTAAVQAEASQDDRPPSAKG